MLLKIKLTVPGGGLVSFAHILPMTPLPKVVCWGQRFFAEDGTESERVPVYTEVLMGWCLPETYAAPTD